MRNILTMMRRARQFLIDARYLVRDHDEETTETVVVLETIATLLLVLIDSQMKDEEEEEEACSKFKTLPWI